MVWVKGEKSLFLCGNGAKHVRFNRLDVLEKKKKAVKNDRFLVFGIL